MTPRQFYAMVEHRRNSQRHERERQEFIAGQIASAIYNSGFRQYEHHFTPQDFMLTRQKPKPKRHPSRKIIANRLRSFMDVLIAQQNAKG